MQLSEIRFIFFCCPGPAEQECLVYVYLDCCPSPKAQQPLLLKNTQSKEEELLFGRKLNYNVIDSHGN